MARQFFVGGNFKLNPVSLAAKASLVNGLNSASLDPNVGEHNTPLTPQRHVLNVQLGK